MELSIINFSNEVTLKSSGLAQHMISRKLCHLHLLKLLVCADGPFFPSPCSVSRIKAFGAAQQLLRAPDIPVASGNSPPTPFFRSWLGWDRSSEIETSMEIPRKTVYSHEDFDVEYTSMSWLQCRKGRSWLFYPQSLWLLLPVMQLHRFSLSVTSQSMTKKFKYKMTFLESLDWCLIILMVIPAINVLVWYIHW